jgi:hypothetical protein
VNAYDQLNGSITWNTTFTDDLLRRQYGLLSDRQRWQITNLLLFDRSPYLWFYFRRSGEPKADCEREMCETYLETVFERASTKQRVYLQRSSGEYEALAASNPYPSAAPDASVVPIVEAVDGKTPMREIRRRLGFDSEFDLLNLARIRTATSAFPFLRAVLQTSSASRHARNSASLARLENHGLDNTATQR